MASTQHDNPHDQPPSMDYREHERTYRSFIGITKWVIVALAITMVLLFFVVQP